VGLPTRGNNFARHRIKPVAKVYAEQSENGHENAQADAGAALELKRTKICEIAVVVARFEEG